MTRLISAIAVLILLAAGGAYLLLDRGEDASAAAPSTPAASERNGTGTAAADIERVAEEPATIREMTLGTEDAPVTVIEYASFTCPHCRNFHEGPFRKLKKEYIDTGKVRFIYRDVYFDRYGLWASMIARCEGDKFFGVADLIYKGQSEWARGNSPEEIVSSLRKIGRLAGISDERLDACLSDANKAQALVAWYQKNAQADGIEATPSFVINGKLVENQPWERFKAILDAELNR